LVWLNTASTPQKQPAGEDRGLEAFASLAMRRARRVEVGSAAATWLHAAAGDRQRCQQRAREHQASLATICAARISA
jgi:hypothetical protein